MAHQKARSRSESGRSRDIGAAPKKRTDGAKAVGAGSERELTEVDREIIEALTDFRDALRDRVPLETKYTVRQVVVVVPPPPLAPADVRQIRESLGLSQPVFADFLGTSTATVRSWEQGQKPPSPMARRFLGLIAADPPYWKSQFRSIVRTREEKSSTSSGPGVPSGAVGERSGEVVHPRRRTAAEAKDFRRPSRPKLVNEPPDDRSRE
jgi:putative transcriptional regulator